MAKWTGVKCEEGFLGEIGNEEGSRGEGSHSKRVLSVSLFRKCNSGRVADERPKKEKE